MILDRTHLPLVDEFKAHSWNSHNRMTEFESNTWNSIELEIYKGTPGIYLSAELNTEGKIELLNVSYTVNSLWGLKRNSVEEWVVGLTRARDITTRVRSEQIERLIWPVMQIMESEGRFAFYMVRRIPQRVGWNNIDDYLKSRHPAIGNIDRYDARALHIMRTPADRRTARLFEQLTPEAWPGNRNIAVIRHDLQYRYRS